MTRQFIVAAGFILGCFSTSRGQDGLRLSSEVIPDSTIYRIIQDYPLAMRYSSHYDTSRVLMICSDTSVYYLREGELSSRRSWIGVRGDDDSLHVKWMIWQELGWRVETYRDGWIISTKFLRSDKTPLDAGMYIWQTIELPTQHYKHIEL